jgi:hypothetical protein
MRRSDVGWLGRHHDLFQDVPDISVMGDESNQAHLPTGVRAQQRLMGALRCLTQR